MTRLVTMLLAMSLAAAAAAAPDGRGAAAASRPERDADEAAIRDRVKGYETEFNAGDVSAVIAEYHPSMSGITAGAFLDHDAYMAAVRKLMAQSDHDRMRLELHSIRRLGKAHALANGEVVMISKSGTEQRGPFTLLYLKSRGRWKLIYSHD